MSLSKQCSPRTLIRGFWVRSPVGPPALLVLATRGYSWHRPPGRALRSLLHAPARLVNRTTLRRAHGSSMPQPAGYLSRPGPLRISSVSQATLAVRNEEDQWAPLWDDVVRVADSYVTAKLKLIPKFHSGAVVYESKPSSPEMAPTEVIDGCERNRQPQGAHRRHLYEAQPSARFSDLADTTG